MSKHITKIHTAPSDIINGGEGKYCASKTYRFLLISNWTERIYKRYTLQADCILCPLHTDTKLSHIHRSFFQ